MSKSQKRPWTAEEIEYLKDNVGLKSFDAIAKRLERSKISVYRKAERLELGTYVENTEYLSINDIAEMLVCGNSLEIMEEMTEGGNG